MRFFVIAFFTLLLSFSTALAQDEQNVSEPAAQPEEEIQAKRLYQSYHELPKKLFKGQVFTLTIKALSTNENYKSLDYDFSNEEGITLLSEEKAHALISPYFYDTFYFQVTGNSVRIPDVTTSLEFNNDSEALSETIRGHTIQTIRLNPENDFCGVLAEEFRILEYKTKQYDNQNNIVVFSAEAKMANLKDFSLKAAVKEGIDGHIENLPYSTLTYYAVVSKQFSELKFVYFDIKNHRFHDVIIPIIVSNDRVSTQSDLAPTQNTHTLPKILIAAAASVLGLALFFYRRKKFYLILFLVPLFFIAKLSIPTEYVCISQGAKLYLLPLRNGTIFEEIPSRFTTESLGESQGFTKIRMPNKQIGWVKNENICSN